MSVVLFAFALAVQPVEASPVPAPVQPVAAKPVSEKRTCRSQEETVGSRMRKKLCLTESEWARRDAGVSANDLKTMGAR